MKSWADHCSDSEDEDAHHHPAAATAPPAWHESSSEDEAADQVPEPAPARTYTLADVPPGCPPFTAFVSSLPYSIKSADELVGEVQRLILSDAPGGGAGGDAGISTARLGKDRKTGKQGGFGYVEFGTAEDLLTLLNLPPPAQIRGRDIKVDIATQRQQPSGGGGDRGASFRGSGRGSRTDLSGSLDDIDGSNFRGGRGSMSRNGSGRNDNNNNGNRRNSNNNRQRKDDSSTNNSGPPPARQSLKLAPRTKPAEGAERGSSSSIFGAAKPRNEAAWEAEREKRSSLAKAADGSKKKEKKKRNNSSDGGGDEGGKGGDKKDKDLRRSASSSSVGKGGRGGGGAKRSNSSKSTGGKGGRGGGGGKGGRGGGGGGGGSGRKSDSQKSAGGGKEEKKKPEPTIPKSAIVAPPAEKKKNDKKVVNKFAALGFDSDSD